MFTSSNGSGEGLSDEESNSCSRARFVSLKWSWSVAYLDDFIQVLPLPILPQFDDGFFGHFVSLDLRECQQHVATPNFETNVSKSVRERVAE